MSQPHSRTRLRRAYTLIELLITVALLGLAATLLLPNLVGREALEVQAAVRLVIGDISFAQADALAHQEYRRVHFYGDGSGYCVTRVTEAEVGTTFDPDTADYIFAPLIGSENQQFIIDFEEDERFVAVNLPDVDLDGGGTDLFFDPLGGTIQGGNAPGTGGFIEIASADETYRILVSAFTGKMTVQKVVE